MRISTLKKRAEFQRIRGGGRASLPAFVLEGKARVVGAAVGARMPRFGFTVTKKLGGAVVRNRIRRRLKAALSEVAKDLADPGFDYVVVARDIALTRPFDALRSDLAAAFQRVHSGAGRASHVSDRKGQSGAGRGRGKSAENPASRNK